jgi:DnaK suppressor protein
MNQYGLVLGLGFLVAAFILWRQARREALNEERVIDTMLLTVFWGAAAGRLGFCLLNQEMFRDLGRIVLFVKYPGFSYLGAVIGAGAVLFWRERKNWLKTVRLYFWPGIIMTAASGNLGTKEGLTISLLLFFTKYTKIVKVMIKFPQNVLVGIKKYLEERKRSTEHQLAELKKEDPFEDKSRLLDQAANDSEANQKSGHERTQALIRQMNGVLIEIKKALTRIKIGKYGICEKCGKMIDTDRLAAMPTATLCVSCAKKK